jgi:hypothetical protein
MNRVILKLLISAILCVCTFANTYSQQVDTMELHGFKIEYDKVGLDKLKHMQSSLERQIEIVEQVNLPSTVLEYFKTVSVVIVPKLDTGFGHANMEEGRQIVELMAADLPTDRPILLHELLHAYHGQKLGPTPMIRDSYQQALKSGVYQRYAKAHFLENPREYFAVIGSIFLYGKKIDQPPFDCALTAKYQPQFIAFLTEQFGPHPCK